MKPKFVLAATGWLLAASAAMTVTSRAEDTIRIANVDSLSGAISALGTDVYRGLHLAVDQINANGGVKSLGGAKIELVDYDNQSKVELAQSMTEKAIADGAVAIIGNSSSAAALASTTVAERARIPIVISGGSAEQIVQRGYRYTFKINPNPNSIDKDTEASLENFFSGDVVLKKLIHVHEDGAWGQDVNHIYETVAPAMKIGLEEVPYKFGTSDMSGLISRLRRTDGQALVFTGYLPDAITFSNAYGQAGLRFPYMHVGISLTDGNYTKAVSAQARDNFFGYQYFNPDIVVKGNEKGPRAFADAYKAKFGVDPGFISANAWTSMMVLHKALETAASTEPQKIRDALAANTFGPADGHIMPYPEVKFDATGLNVNANLMTIQQQDGKIVVVWPLEYATGKARVIAN